ncbi:MAG: hypothetical protein U0Q16_17060 [Bryobacteraceae bacterium]
MNPDTRQNVHAMVDQLPPLQLAAVEKLLHSMIDPLSMKLAMAPIDDEPLAEEDRQAIAEADAWSKHNQPIPMEAVLADFGLTMADWENMAKTPPDVALNGHRKNG